MIEDLNELIKTKKKDLKECQVELSNWDHPKIIRDALGFYRLELEEDIERFELMLVDALKRDAGIS